MAYSFRFTVILARIVITLMCVFIDVSETARSRKQLTFHLELNQTRGPIRLAPGWIEDSVASCVTSCMSKFSSCKSVMFNSGTGLCTPGSFIKENLPPPTSAEGRFYHSFYCDRTKGFNLVSFGSTTACIGTFKPPLKYQEASEACMNKGGYLMSVKKFEKLQLFWSIWDRSDTWVGCDDIDQNGAFVWEEDDQVMTATEKTAVFAEGEPNNYQDNEYCGIILLPTGRLNDYNCAFQKNYACEIQMSQ